MPRKPRRIIWFAFLIATVSLVAASLYSYDFYFGVFKAMRSLQLSVADFDFKIVDSTKLVTTTTVTLNNTSSFEFLALALTHRVFLNNMFVGVGSEGTPEISKENPLLIGRLSGQTARMTLTLEIVFMREELQQLLLDALAQKNWLVFVDATLQGPLIGKFSLDTAQQIGTS